MNTGIERAKRRLTEAGLKATHQRLVILDVLQDSKDHPTAEQVYAAIKPGNPTISLATVYKTLETFVDNDLIHKVSTREGQMRYDPVLESHGHIFCAKTREIVDYYDKELDDLVTEFFKKKKVSNLKIKNITLQINGEKLDPEKEVSIK